MSAPDETPDATAPDPARVPIHAPDPAPAAAAIHDARRWRARLLIAALVAAVLLAIAPYIPGLLGAGVLYVVCRPAYARLAPRIGPRTAALALDVAAVALVLLPAAWLLVIAIAQAPGALSRVLASEEFLRLSTLHAGPVDIGAQLSRAGTSFVDWASRELFSIVGGVTRAILNILIALVGLYYLFTSADVLWSWVRRLVPFSDAGTELLRARFSSVTEATLLGIVATGLAQGTTVGLAFWAVGLPNPVVWGLVTAIVSVLPVLGSALVWVPGVVVLLAGERYLAAAVLAVIGLVIASNIDNVVRPVVYRRHSGVHPMATLLGAFAGVELLGLVGLLLGPLAISYVFELLRLYEEEYGAAPPARSSDAPSSVAPSSGAPAPGARPSALTGARVSGDAS